MTNLQRFTELFDLGLHPIPVQFNPETRQVVKYGHPPHEKDVTGRVSIQDVRRWIKKPMFKDANGMAFKLYPPFGMFDFDLKNTEDKTVFDKWLEKVRFSIPNILSKIVIETTRSSGYHVYIKYTGLTKKTGLAGSKKGEEVIAIYTGGTLSYTVPSPGYNITSGSFENLAELTKSEFEILCNTAIEFDQSGKQKPGKLDISVFPKACTEYKGQDAFGDYNYKTDLQELLESYGYTFVEKTKERIYMLRPGESTANSSGNIHIEKKLWHCFSSSTEFDPRKAYNAVQVYTILQHGGDFSKASQQLRDEGYGATVEVMEKKSKKDKVAGIKKGLQYTNPLRRNLITDQIEIQINEKWEVVNINNIWSTLKGNYSQSDILSYLYSDNVEAYDPFAHYFDALPPWDGVDHIDALGAHITCTDQDAWQTHFKKALVRMVAQGLGEAVNRYMLVIQGEKQNTGKSTFLRFLSPFGPKYFTESSISGDKKDVMISMGNNFIQNCEELEGISKIELGLLKKILSTDVICERPPYGRIAVVKKRRVNFVGSCNNANLLQDTENTRWLLFEVLKVDWKYSTKIDIHKVWAQAVHLYRNDLTFSYHLTESEVKAQAETNEAYRIDKPEEDLIAKYFDKPTENHPGNFLSSTDILHALSRKYHHIRLNSKNIGSAVQKVHGIKSVFIKENGKSRRGYWLISKMLVHEIL